MHCLCHSWQNPNRIIVSVFPIRLKIKKIVLSLRMVSAGNLKMPQYNEWVSTPQGVFVIQQLRIKSDFDRINVILSMKLRSSNTTELQVAPRYRRVSTSRNSVLLSPEGCDFDFKRLVFKCGLVITFLSASSDCLQVNGTAPYWWSVNVGTDNGLVMSSTNPISESMLTEVYDATWRH